MNGLPDCVHEAGLANSAVTGHQRESVANRGGYKDAVEGVRLRKSKFHRRGRDPRVHREDVEAGREVFKETAGRLIDQDALFRYQETELEQQEVGHADLIPLQTFDRDPGRTGKALVALHEPESGVGIQEQAHRSAPHSESGRVGRSRSSAESRMRVRMEP